MTGPFRIDGGLASVKWQWIGQLLAMRAGERCEACGQLFVPGLREPSIHHRQPRGMGGTTRPDVNDLCNLMLVCAGFSRGMAGVLGCHGALESDRADAERRGWLVLHPLDPADVPVALYSGRRVTLDTVGPFYLPPSDGVLWLAA